MGLGSQGYPELPPVVPHIQDLQQGVEGLSTVVQQGGTMFQEHLHSLSTTVQNQGQSLREMYGLKAVLETMGQDQQGKLGVIEEWAHRVTPD